MSYLIGLVNLIFSVYLIRDSADKIHRGVKLMVFDQYLYGAAKFIPFLLAASIIFASLNVIFKINSKGLLHTYLNSFLFLLFYTPTVVFNRNDDVRYFYLLGIQFILMMLCIFLIYAKGDKTEYRMEKNRTSKYEEYKRSMAKFNDKKEQ